MKQIGIVFLGIGLIVLFGFCLSGCDESNSPTADDPVPTAPPPTDPTPTPMPTATQSPQMREYFGISYRGDTGEAVGTINYTINQYGDVEGHVDMFWECHSVMVPEGYDEVFGNSFTATDTYDGEFNYRDQFGGSPHDYGLSKIECTSGGENPQGIWLSYRSWSTGSCSGSGTWEAELVN